MCFFLLLYIAASGGGGVGGYPVALTPTKFQWQIPTDSEVSQKLPSQRWMLCTLEGCLPLVTVDRLWPGGNPADFSAMQTFSNMVYILVSMSFPWILSALVDSLPFYS